MWTEHAGYILAAAAALVAVVWWLLLPQPDPAPAPAPDPQPVEPLRLPRRHPATNCPNNSDVDNADSAWNDAGMRSWPDYPCRCAVGFISSNHPQGEPLLTKNQPDGGCVEDTSANRMVTEHFGPGGGGVDFTRGAGGGQYTYEETDICVARPAAGASPGRAKPVIEPCKDEHNKMGYSCANPDGSRPQWCFSADGTMLTEHDMKTESGDQCSEGLVDNGCETKCNADGNTWTFLSKAACVGADAEQDPTSGVWTGTGDLPVRGVTNAKRRWNPYVGNRGCRSNQPDDAPCRFIKDPCKPLPGSPGAECRFDIATNQCNDECGIPTASQATCTGAPATCTGIAADTSKTCDLDASTDGTAECPTGCTKTPDCSRADDCPEACAFEEGVICTAPPDNPSKTCDWVDDTGHPDFVTCPSGCKGWAADAQVWPQWTLDADSALDIFDADFSVQGGDEGGSVGLSGMALTSSIPCQKQYDALTGERTDDCGVGDDSGDPVAMNIYTDGSVQVIVTTGAIDTCHHDETPVYYDANTLNEGPVLCGCWSACTEACENDTGLYNIDLSSSSGRSATANLEEWKHAQPGSTKTKGKWHDLAFGDSKPVPETWQARTFRPLQLPFSANKDLCEEMKHHPKMLFPPPCFGGDGGCQSCLQVEAIPDSPWGAKGRSQGKALDYTMGTCTETAAGTAASVHADAVACAAVTELDTGEECEKVKTAANNDVSACTYSNSNYPANTFGVYNSENEDWISIKAHQYGYDGAGGGDAIPVSGIDLQRGADWEDGNYNYTEWSAWGEWVSDVNPALPTWDPHERPFGVRCNAHNGGPFANHNYKGIDPICINTATKKKIDICTKSHIYQVKVSPDVHGAAESDSNLTYKNLNGGEYVEVVAWPNDETLALVKKVYADGVFVENDVAELTLRSNLKPNAKAIYEALSEEDKATAAIAEIFAGGGDLSEFARRLQRQLSLQPDTCIPPGRQCGINMVGTNQAATDRCVGLWDVELHCPPSGQCPAVGAGPEEQYSCQGQEGEWKTMSASWIKCESGGGVAPLLARSHKGCSGGGCHWPSQSRRDDASVAASASGFAAPSILDSDVSAHTKVCACPAGYRFKSHSKNNRGIGIASGSGSTYETKWHSFWNRDDGWAATGSKQYPPEQFKFQCVPDDDDDSFGVHGGKYDLTVWPRTTPADDDPANINRKITDQLGSYKSLDFKNTEASCDPVRWPPLLDEEGYLVDLNHCRVQNPTPDNCKEQDGCIFTPANQVINPSSFGVSDRWYTPHAGSRDIYQECDGHPCRRGRWTPEDPGERGDTDVV